jgi:hypothetical protein
VVGGPPLGFQLLLALVGLQLLALPVVVQLLALVAPVVVQLLLPFLLLLLLPFQLLHVLVQLLAVVEALPPPWAVRQVAAVVLGFPLLLVALLALLGHHFVVAPSVEASWVASQVALSVRCWHPGLCPSMILQGVLEQLLLLLLLPALSNLPLFLPVGVLVALAHRGAFAAGLMLLQPPLLSAATWVWVGSAAGRPNSGQLEAHCSLLWCCCWTCLRWVPVVVAIGPLLVAMGPVLVAIGGLPQ